MHAVKKKSSIIAIVLMAFLVLTIVYKVRANVSGSNFQLYLNNTASLGVQAKENYTITFTITNGTLNSTSTRIFNDPDRIGYLYFNSSSICNVSVSFENLKVNVNGANILDGHEFTPSAYSYNRIQWWVLIPPFLPIMFLLGMVGLASMFGGVLYPVMLFKRKEYVLALKMFTIFFFLGLGLFMAWVFV